MHSIHALPARADHHADPMQMQQQQQQMHEPQDQTTTTMTVLESLDPTATHRISVDHQQQQQHQVMSVLVDPVVQQQQQQQQQQSHLVQTAGHSQPHLHQLQPSHPTSAATSAAASMTDSALASGGQMVDEQQQQQQQQQQSQVSISHRATSNNLLRQRHQIEGIVADGGGPIVQWLLDNYEIADGESLPRSTVYNHYLAHCRQLQMASVNAASFGKLIRSVFVGLKTRRLGTRGHSKYHYFGVRAKQHIQQELLQHQESVGCSSHESHAHSLSHHSTNDNSNQNTDNGSESDSTGGGGHECGAGGGRLSSAGSNKRVKRTANSGPRGNNQQMYHQQQAGEHDVRQLVGDDIGPSNGVYYSNESTTNGYNNNNGAPAGSNSKTAAVLGGGGIGGVTGSLSGSGNTGDHVISALEQAPQHHHQHHHQQQQQQQQQPHHHHHHHHQQQQQHHHQQQHHQYTEMTDFSHHLGANWSTLVDEHWPPREACQLEHQLLKATGLSELANSFELFEAKYKSYYKRMVELLSELKFAEVGQLWQEFWHPSEASLVQLAAPASLHHAHQASAQDESGQWMAAGNGGAITTKAVEPGNQQQEQAQQQAQHHHQQQHEQQQNGQQQQQQSSVSDITSQHLDYLSHEQHQQQQQRPATAAESCTPLTFPLMYQLTSLPTVVERINEIDYNLYAAIESFLLPDVLLPIPRQLAQHIRDLAMNIGPWIEHAVKDYEPQFMAEKSKSARAFGYALRRYTSLNHLSTASRAVWEKRSSLAQMSMDLSRVDLRDIEHQVSLMSHHSNSHVDELSSGGGGGATGTANLLGCSTGLATSATTTTTTTATTAPGASNNRDNCGSGAKDNLAGQSQQQQQQLGQQNQSAASEQQDNSNNENANHHLIDQHHHSQHQHHHQHHQHHHPQHLCAIQPGQLIQNFLHLLEDPYPANSWPDWCRNLVESRVCGLSLEEARNFVLKWNFYISLIMKELTLKAAPSFGSFQLIRLLFDEYIFYLVVTRLAQAQNKTPAQLLSM